MRRPFLAANWKMHLDRAAVADFCRRLRGLDEALAADGEQAPRIALIPQPLHDPLFQHDISDGIAHAISGHAFAGDVGSLGKVI